MLCPQIKTDINFLIDVQVDSEVDLVAALKARITNGFLLGRKFHPSTFKSTVKIAPMSGKKNSF
jgi:hypothetical protein